MTCRPGWRLNLVRLRLITTAIPMHIPTPIGGRALVSTGDRAFTGGAAIGEAGTVEDSGTGRSDEHFRFRQAAPESAAFFGQRNPFRADHYERDGMLS